MCAVEDLMSRFFFFSSRRRHTRCSRDWSSDVCSSDLPTVVSAVLREDYHRPRPPPPASARPASRLDLGAAGAMPALRQDVHHPAQVVVAAWALQLPLSATSLGGDVPTRGETGAIGSSHPTSRSIAR